MTMYNSHQAICTPVLQQWAPSVLMSYTYVIYSLNSKRLFHLCNALWFSGDWAIEFFYVPPHHGSNSIWWETVCDWVTNRELLEYKIDCRGTFVTIVNIHLQFLIRLSCDPHECNRINLWLMIAKVRLAISLRLQISGSYCCLRCLRPLPLLSQGLRYVQHGYLYVGCSWI